MTRLIVRELDGEIVVLDRLNDQVHQLNPTASLIWQMRRDGASVEQTAEALALRFDVDKDIAERDVHVALEQFKTAGILKSSGDKTSESADTRISVKEEKEEKDDCP